MPPRLLLADDSVTVQRVIELTFADENIAVISVGSGDDAVARLEAEPFDIVLADVGMPGRDGFEVARFVRERPATAHVPVILLTGAYEQVDTARVAASGASAVLPKPFEPQAVIQKVRELLAGRPSPAAAPVPASAAAGARLETVDARAPIASPAAPPPSSVDDYFDRLDRAFASLEVAATEPPQAGVTGGVTPETPGPFPSPAPAAEAAFRAGEVPAGPAPAPAAPAATPPPAATPGADPAAGLADAFVALLAMEQGEAPPPPVAPFPAADDEALVDRIARRVVERLGDEAVRRVAADIVSRTAERLVREEIERLKQLS